MNKIYRMIILLLVSSVVACASDWQTINAANDEDRDIGLGGTGMLADAGSGLGGTGIVGEITGFGSIFVNGVEIEYHEGTPFTVDGEAAPMPVLQIGDVVEVLTTDDSRHTQAQRINLRHEVIGKVTAVDAKTASFTVLGQTVMQSAVDKTLPQPGRNVAVSGFRIDASTIQATRVVASDASRQLLRKHIALPFRQQAERWLIQAHVSEGRITLDLDGVTHKYSVIEKSAGPVDSDSASSIIQLHKTASGELVVDRVNEPLELPRGRQIQLPVPLPGGIRTPGTMPVQPPGSLQRPGPGSMRMSLPPPMYRRG